MLIRCDTIFTNSMRNVKEMLVANVGLSMFGSIEGSAGLFGFIHHLVSNSNIVKFVLVAGNKGQARDFIIF